MRTPAVAIASLLLALFSTAEAQENRDLPISDTVSALVTPDTAPAKGGELIRLASRNVPAGDAAELDIEQSPAPVERAKTILRELRPFGNNFFVGGGAYKGGQTVGLGTPPQRDVSLGDMTFPVTEYGPVESRIGYDETVPFVGGGFTRSFAAKGRVDVKVLAGAAFYGAATLEEDAFSEAQRAREYNVQPLMQVGLSFKF